ncbi:polymer-forming cytoskeletal protein [Marinospirillum sp. MEB164]|uniref:Polymer-forming cytoskeletal protein n=1 Tax=Marinospirillum alkalitolerans TaxID=3123374 RepID=A0ABW8PZK5_9GAMM
MFGKNAPAANHFDTLISSKAEIVGDIHFSGGLHIDGRVHGNIIADDDSKAVLRISDKGRVEGEVSVPHLVVNGTIVGDVHSCEHLELAAKAVVKGNIFYNTVEMVMGAQVDGRLEHRYKSSGKGGEKPVMPKKVTREKPSPLSVDAPDTKVLNKPEPKAMPQAAPQPIVDKKQG